MKIIKKIAAIMLSVMMVLGMCSVVGAKGTSETTAATGSITIDNATSGETYNIYRILDLESYSGSENTENYAYKLRTTKATGSTKSWSDFIKSTEINDTYVTLDGEYVTWKNGVETTSDKAAEFAKKALDYAKNSATKINPDATKRLSASETSAIFTGLPLGYYLVETSVGTVLALDTTNPDKTINDKNTAPTVEKKVSETKAGNYEGTSTASIGDTVYFKTTIHAKKGAKNYVLHDTMSAGLTFDEKSIDVKKQGDSKSLNQTSDYSLVTNNTGDGCTFHIQFKESFCNSITADTDIIVTYSATLNENAAIGATGNTNKTQLSYGDNSKTTEATTTTKTFEVLVHKFTMKNNVKKALKDATFKLSTDSEGNNVIHLNKKKGTSTEEYIVDSTRASTTTTVTTTDTGEFTIKGLAAGTYYLTETKQPDGYNKLTSPVKITIDATNGTITVGDSERSVTEVEVENKTGSLLPSTGGMGTTLFYIFGAILVIGSGVVLITKKRMK